MQIRRAINSTIDNVPQTVTDPAKAKVGDIVLMPDGTYEMTATGKLRYLSATIGGTTDPEEAKTRLDEAMVEEAQIFSKAVGNVKSSLIIAGLGLAAVLWLFR